MNCCTKCIGIAIGHQVWCWLVCRIALYAKYCQNISLHPDYIHIMESIQPRLNALHTSIMIKKLLHMFFCFCNTCHLLLNSLKGCISSGEKPHFHFKTIFLILTSILIKKWLHMVFCFCNICHLLLNSLKGCISSILSFFSLKQI